MYVKNKKKILASVLIFSFVLGSVVYAVQIKSTNSTIENKTKKELYGTKQSINIDADIIASIPEQNIYLYGLNKDENTNNMYRNLILSINGVNRVFNWSNTASISHFPELYLNDLNNDGKKELIVILHKGGGTGLCLDTAHVINPENFTEYKVENPLDIIKNNITTKIISPKKVQILLNGNILKTIETDEYYPDISKVYYNDWICYSVLQDNTFTVTVGIQIAPSNYIGSIVIDYSLKDGIFKADKISVIED